MAEVASVNLKFKNFLCFFFCVGYIQKKKEPLEIVGDNKMLIFDDISTDEPIKFMIKKLIAYKINLIKMIPYLIFL